MHEQHDREGREHVGDPGQAEGIAKISEDEVPNPEEGGEMQRHVTELEPLAKPEVYPPSSTYGPVRESRAARETRLTRAMRENLSLLDHGRPARHVPGNQEHGMIVEVEDDVFVVSEADVLAVEKKKGRKEVLEREIPEGQKASLVDAKRKE